MGFFMQVQPFIVGIDLGTTNSEVAALIDGKPVLLRDGPSDSGIVPSVVGLNAKGDMIVGQAARNQWVLAPERTIVSIKRCMGQDTTAQLGEQALTPVQVSANILRTLKQKAERVLGQDVTGAVITVPAYFTDAQRQATRAAGKEAGIDVKRIINEPTAAALAYDGAKGSTSGTALIYDLGGGTFDVSVVQMQEGIVEVLATAGNNHLGGDDFDALIADKLVESIEHTDNVTLDADNAILRARLLRAAEIAKIELSKSPFARVVIDQLATAEDGSFINLDKEISRHELNEWLKPKLDETLRLVASALEDAKQSPSDLSQVILVGGSSRMPYIRELLFERLGHEPFGSINPDLCVALGAAVQAGLEMGQQVDSVLVDITPYTFGTAVRGDFDSDRFGHHYIPILRRNSKLPAVATEVVYKQSEDQTAIEIRVYQGEHLDARQNTQIGTFMFEGLRCREGDVEKGILFTYKLNLDGILEIIAVERATQKRLTCRVEHALDAEAGARDSTADLRLDDGVDEQESLREALDVRVDSPLDDAAHDTHANSVEDLRLRIADLRKRATLMRASASPDDVKEIDSLLAQLGDDDAEENLEATQPCVEQLDDLLFFLS